MLSKVGLPPLSDRYTSSDYLSTSYSRRSSELPPIPSYSSKFSSSYSSSPSFSSSSYSSRKTRRSTIDSGSTRTRRSSSVVTSRRKYLLSQHYVALYWGIPLYCCCFVTLCCPLLGNSPILLLFRNIILPFPGEFPYIVVVL